ncbi:GerAB/ArcD/ProY family transporter [Bacillus marasmi]|uniref:GerAB/ArcD/ProY family transporter n=1 Tax=Bacillus marasmi TaxID=1926279 RepID=UPI0011C952A7|nr:endospore germination permease [Bacillus marasmi]
MRREQITNKEAICLLIIFYMGSSFILGIGGAAKNDAWISGILGLLSSIPIIMVYARLLALFPKKGLFDILELLFGKILGKVISIFYIWYSFHLGALVIRNFGEFINTAALPETPIFIPMICLGILSIVAVRSGIEVMGRISAYILPVLFFLLFAIQIMGIPSWNFHHIKPILGNGWLPVLKGSFSTFAFPFAESVVLLGAFFSLKTSKAPYKVYFTSTIIAGLLIIIITIRNILILGGILPKLYFPSHVAVSRISVGEFLQRVEISVAVVLVFGVFIKSSICLYVTSLGIAKLFNLAEYRSIVIQLGLIMVYFAYTLYGNIFEMRIWAFEVYPYYAFPFQVIVPLVMLLFAEVKCRRVNKKDSHSVET